MLLARSAGDPHTYLVNDTADPLQRSLTSLELSDVLVGAPPPGASATFAPPTGARRARWEYQTSISQRAFVASRGQLGGRSV